MFKTDKHYLEQTILHKQLHTLICIFLFRLTFIFKHEVTIPETMYAQTIKKNSLGCIYIFFLHKDISTHTTIKEKEHQLE